MTKTRTTAAFLVRPGVIAIAVGIFFFVVLVVLRGYPGRRLSLLNLTVPAFDDGVLHVLMVIDLMVILKIVWWMNRRARWKP